MVVVAPSSEAWKRGPRFPLGVCFGRENCRWDSKAWDRSHHIFSLSDSRINLDTCKSNDKQLYFQNPNALQEGPVSTPLGGGRS